MAILQNTTVSGSLVITGDLTARQFILSSSVSYFTESFASGSTRFGDSVDDIMQVTGSFKITGSLVDIDKDGQSLRIFPQRSSGSARIQLQNSASAGVNGANAIIAVESVAGGDQFTGTTPFSFVVGTATAKNFHLGVNSDVKMTISGSNGNVGIGITNPGFQLSMKIAGTANALLAYYNAAGTATSYIGIPNGSGDVVSTSTTSDFCLRNDTGNILFATNGNTERMRITSGGLVGIGTTNPSSILDVRAGAGTSGNILNLSNTTGASASNIAPIRFYAGNTFGGLEQIAAIWGINPNAGTNNGGTLVFATSTNGTSTTPTERMRIANSGYVGINCSPAYRLHASSDECGNYVAQIHNVNSGDCGGSGVLILQGGTFNSSGDITSRYISVRRGDGTEIGAIRRNGATNVAFDTSSDYRLKEDLKDFNGLDKLSRIKVYDFQWKDTTDRMDGVLAHELQEVVPYAVGGVKDEMTEDGKPQYQGVDYSKLVPTLIKAVQELKAENDSLKEILTRNNIA